MYIKVTQTTYYGETCEAVPFAVIKSEDGYTMDYLDSDVDGLPDIFEIEIGTKVELPDSDEDGLTDYQELYFTDTDPTIYDSVTAGIRDADIDLDSDGLSNVFELENEIDPLLEDTDDDCISDYDEIYVYGTKPDIPDSDEDKVDDGAEIKLGLDPNNPETFGYPDAEHSIEQQIEADSPVMTEVNTVENAYELSLEMKTNGYAEDVISISESGYASSIENEAMLGISTDIEINNSCNPENIVLKYTIKDEYLKNTLGTYADCEEFQGIKRLNIFKYFEELNMLLPIETQFDEANNLIYAETDELGTYCVMDMEIWLDGLGVTPAEEIEEELNLSEVEFEFESPVILSDVSNGIYENYKYILQSDETISISKYIGEDTELIIPSEINGYPVTSIGSGAFSNSDTLISVTIPDSVTSIGLAAFSSCDNLQEVSIPNSITSIPKRAFAWCYKLENISFSDSITIIDEFAFYFASISKLDIPNGVEYIGTHAFGSCKSLTEVTISESVLTIHDAAFDFCGNLESFTVDENNRKYISDDGVVYSRDKSELVFYPIAKADFSFTVPESVNIIRDRAFTYNKNIKTINLTKNIRYIMDSAFCLCPALENIYVVEENPYYQSINGVLFNKEYNAVVKYPEGRTDSEYFIPEGTLQIWKFSFAHCNNLVKLILPDGITCIKEYSFDRCLSLAEINLPDSITRIGFYAFCSCESLNNIVIPQGISQIEEKTFIGCDSLSSITIPENVKIINDPFYEKNENLTIYGYLTILSL